MSSNDRTMKPVPKPQLSPQDKLRRDVQTKIWVESKAHLSDPISLGTKRFSDFFDQPEFKDWETAPNPDAIVQAIWVLRPEAKEPYRLSWRQVLEGGRSK